MRGRPFLLGGSTLRTLVFVILATLAGVTVVCPSDDASIIIFVGREDGRAEEEGDC